MSEKELEELREANYKLKLNLESARQSHMVEVEYLKEEIQVKENELTILGDKLKAEFKQNLGSAQERLASMTEDFQQSRDENNVLKGQIEQLQKTIEHLRTNQVDRNSRNEQFETTKIALDQLNMELSSTRSLLEKQQSKVHHLTQLTEKQSVEISELSEDTESKDQCISQLQSRMREMESERQEAILQLQTVMIQKKDEEVDDPTRRGNSLFSEVDKRRLRVEEELNRLRERVARLTSENVELQSTIERGDCRSEIILHQLQLIHKSSNELIHELKKLKSESLQSFDTYRDRFEVLKKEYKRKLTQYRDGVDSPGVRELETIRDERDLLTSQKMSLERELWDMKKELKYTQQQRTESEANLKILRLKLLATQEQLETMSKSEKTKPDANAAAATSMESSPARASHSSASKLAPGSGGRRDNQNWLYNSMANDTKRNLSAGSEATTSLRSSRSGAYKSTARSTTTTINGNTGDSGMVNGSGPHQVEDIGDCKTQ